MGRISSCASLDCMIWGNTTQDNWTCLRGGGWDMQVEIQRTMPVTCAVDHVYRKLSDLYLPNQCFDYRNAGRVLFNIDFHFYGVNDGVALRFRSLVVVVIILKWNILSMICLWSICWSGSYVNDACHSEVLSTTIYSTILSPDNGELRRLGSIYFVLCIIGSI